MFAELLREGALIAETELVTDIRERAGSVANRGCCLPLHPSCMKLRRRPDRAKGYRPLLEESCRTGFHPVQTG